MCGTLKFEGLAKKKGDLVLTHDVQDGKTIKAHWGGFAQAESVQSFWNRRADPHKGVIIADSFVEGGYGSKAEIELSIPSHKIQAMLVRKDVLVDGRLVGKAGDVKIVTRAPRNDFEKSIHNRWPLVYIKKTNENGIVQDSVYVWTAQDIVKGQTVLPY